MMSDRERLLDIQEAIERIEKHSAVGREGFDEDELIRTWIVHHLQIIGEAARGLSSEIRSRHSEVPWPQIIAMRNILVHQYFEIDRDLVWGVVERELPALKAAVSRMIAESGSG